MRAKRKTDKKLLEKVHFAFHWTQKHPNLSFFFITNPIAKLQLWKEPQQYLFISSNIRLHSIHLLFTLWSKVYLFFIEIVFKYYFLEALLVGLRITNNYKKIWVVKFIAKILKLWLEILEKLGGIKLLNCAKLKATFIAKGILEVSNFNCY